MRRHPVVAIVIRIVIRAEQRRLGVAGHGPLARRIGVRDVGEAVGGAPAQPRRPPAGGAGTALAAGCW